MRLAWLLVIGVGCGDGATQAPSPDAPPPCARGLTDLVTVGHEAASGVAAGFLDPGRTTDLVLANDSVTVMTGKGDHTFAPGWSFPPSSARSVGLADLDRDGKLDLVIGVTGGIDTLVGNGDGTFTAKEAASTYAPPTSIAFGDLDLDGNLDVVTSSSGGSTLGFYRGLGNGEVDLERAIEVGPTPGPVTIADLDNDLYPDLITTSSGGTPAVVSVVWGGPGATFSAPDNHPFTSPSSLPFGVAVGDVNEDGHLDVVVADGGGKAIRILLGDGHRQLTDAAPLATQGNLPMSVALGDVDHDGHPDIVTATMGAIEVFHGDGHGGFTAAQQLPTMDPSPRTLTLADIDDDRLLDVVLADDLGAPQIAYGGCVR